MNVQFTPRADPDYDDLPPRLKRAVDKQLDFLRDRPQNPRHPSIHAKNIPNRMIFGRAGLRAVIGSISKSSVIPTLSSASSSSKMKPPRDRARVLPVDEPRPDEIEAIERGRAEFSRGEFVRLDDLLPDSQA